ncbi:MAG TPA: lysophospholipase [Anaerolineales bacterium]|nr:lysophospholipase [Anaerolineales bacterium]
MKTFESSWTDARGLKFYSRGWEPDRAPGAAVAFLHGLGDHIGRYAHIAEALSAAGYAMMGMDWRGHGQSGGQRGYAPSLEALMQDIDLLLDNVRARYSGLPTFLYGHSLGAIMALNYALRRKPDLAGVIATDPALHSELEEQQFKVALVRLLGGVAPTVALASGLKTSMLSHDPQIEQAYINDPLVHDRISFGLGKVLLAANEYALKHAAEFQLPLLLMHGSLDTIAYPSSSREFAAAAGDKATLIVWDGMYHEIHNELKKDEVIQAVVHWMNDHLPR